MKEAMVRIKQNRDEMDTLHDLVYDESLDNWERICLSVFFFQLYNDDYIPIKKIEKDTGLEYHQIKIEIERFVKFKVLFEYKPSISTPVRDVKLSWNGISNVAPRVLFDILQDKKWDNSPKFQRITFRHGLTKKKLLEREEPLTIKGKM